MTTVNLGDIDDPVRDDVRLAHDLREFLWQAWGQRSVPSLWITQHETGLRVRGTSDTYTVTIRKEEQ